VVELGCGTAYWSAWLARRGAGVVGLDNSARQLATARALQREHRLAFPLLHADAERVPLAGGRFDLALSEYGASIWCDPHRWIPEAARVLRPGGELVFLKHGTRLTLCAPDGEGAADDWIRLVRGHGFEVLDLLELRAPAGASTRHPSVTAAWAHRWPSEEIWRLRKH
jgi:SAM-dependent methyltransferase